MNLFTRRLIFSDLRQFYGASNQPRSSRYFLVVNRSHTSICLVDILSLSVERRSDRVVSVSILSILLTVMPRFTAKMFIMNQSGEEEAVIKCAKQQKRMKYAINAKVTNKIINVNLITTHCDNCNNQGDTASN